MVGWWQDWHEFKILPIEGRDLASQPFYVYQTIMTGEQEFPRIMKELRQREPQNG